MAARKTLFIEPVTRIEGHLGVRVDIDVDRRVVADAYATGVMFRGFERIMEGRDPPDAVWISQRICGVCPTPHAVASAEALDMALNAPPPPLAVLLRNLADAFEMLYDHTLHWFQLAGPDYSEAVVGERNPSWLKAARETPAEHRDVHGFATIADVMKAMVPLKGSLWLESIDFQRTAKECLTMVAGKYPHLASVVPGGVTYAPTIGQAQGMMFRFTELLPWVKKVLYVAEDLLGFLEKVGYEKAGERPANLISYGAGDDPEAYNARYEDMDEWGIRREVTPGVVIGGELVTNRLTEVHLGIQEFVSHSFYEDWGEREVPEDPLGNEVPLRHPWNKATIPKPSKLDWGSRYSWITAVRWVRGGRVHVVEAGPLARMWITAVSRRVEGSTGKSLKFELPRTAFPGVSQHLNAEVEVEWKVPKRVNVIERLRARAYYLAYMAHAAYAGLLKLLEFLKKGRTEVFRGFERPRWSLGVGLTEAARGALGHWVVVKDGRVRRYQVVTPTNINASSRDADGRRGAYEEALVGTPISEEGAPEAWNGVDVVRVVRSFDPCLACAVSVYVGDRRVDRLVGV